LNFYKTSWINALGGVFDSVAHLSVAHLSVAHCVALVGWDRMLIELP